MLQLLRKPLLAGAVRYIIKSEYEPKQVTDLVKEIVTGYTRGEVPKGKTKARKG
ncbi:hypothetical protein GTO10_02395 [Candidatus Saccharibacteria bacterium]|nr:hypothetical protein [Candidatus Saccharibacteria bacterium]